MMVGAHQSMNLLSGPVLVIRHYDIIVFINYACKHGHAIVETAVYS